MTTPNRGKLISTACLAAALALAQSAPSAEDKAKTGRVLCAFDSDQDLSALEVSANAKLQLVADHATDGGKAGRLTIEKGPYTGMRSKDKVFLSGWGEYQFLRMDVFNPGQKASLEVRIDDSQSTDDYYTWYSGRFQLLPGDNQVEIDLGKLVSPGKRKLDPAKIKLFAFWINPPGTTAFLDNLRLAKADAVALPAAMKAFDFGPAGAVVTAGFTAVDPKTVYSDKTGFGFAPGQSLEGREDAPRAAVPLGKDSVAGPGGKPLAFQVSLTGGKHRLWACTGWSGSYNWPRAAYKVSAGGRTVFEHKPASTDFVEAADYVGRDYSRKTDLWNTFISGQLFDEFEADVTVEGDKLELAVESEKDCRLRGLMVWPAGDAEAAKAVKGVLERRRQDFAAAWREDAPPAGKGEQFANDEEIKRGFRLTGPEWLEPVTPYYVPASPRERLERMAVSAAPGQYEPAVFVVNPTADAEAVVTVSDLTGPSGKIESSAVQVNYVHYRYTASEGYGTSRGVYSVQPAHLVPLGRLKLEKGVPRQFWLIVHVPEGTKAGKYAGTVTVDAGGKSAGVPLEVEVLPFQLDKLTDHGITFAHVTTVYDDPKRMEADLRAYVEHGCNSVTPGGAIGLEIKRQDGKLVFDFHRLDQLMELMRKAGMTGPVPLFDMSVQGGGGGRSYPHLGFMRFFKYKLDSQEYLDDLTELTRQVMERAKEKNYLPVLMYPSTEVSNDEAVGPKFNSKLIAAIRKAGKVECISSVNKPMDLVTAAELEHIMINYGVGMSQETIDRIHKSGAKLWFQNVGQTRYTDGLMMLRCGAVGRRQWVGTWYSGDPYNDWDGEETHNMLLPSRLGSLPTVSFEWMRAGMVDLRCFLTLRRLIETGLKSNSPDVAAAANAAKADCDQMLASCPVSLPAGAEVQRDGLSASWGFADKGTFDKYRRKAAEHLAKLWPMIQRQ